MTRPTLVVAVLGTATDIGKTWTTATLATRLRARGLTVRARKPAQSFNATDADATDAHILALATGESPTTVTAAHRWYPLPMAPPMAADVLGLPVPTAGELATELDWGNGQADVGFYETVGGVASPMATDAHSLDMAVHCGADLFLLVADAHLGTIGSVRLAIGVIADRPTLVFLNRYDDHEPLHTLNAPWLRDIDHLDPVTNITALLARLGNKATRHASTKAAEKQPCNPRRRYRSDPDQDG